MVALVSVQSAVAARVAGVWVSGAWVSAWACVLVLVRHAEDPEPIIAEGRWYGRI